MDTIAEPKARISPNVRSHPPILLPSRDGENLGATTGETLRLTRAFVLSAQPLELLAIVGHAEREAHRPEHRLDLVERLLAEILRLEQLGLGLRHEVGDGPDVRGLEAVGRADGELELLDVPEEVLVLLGPRPRLGALDRRLLRQESAQSALLDRVLRPCCPRSRLTYLKSRYILYIK